MQNKLALMGATVVVEEVQGIVEPARLRAGDVGALADRSHRPIEDHDVAFMVETAAETDVTDAEVAA